MTEFPGEDRHLVRFLRQYQPGVPGVSAELESQIMREVLASVPAPPRRLSRWLVSSAVIVSGLMSWLSYQVLMPSQPQGADLANLEMFVQGNWEIRINDPADSTHSSSFWQEVSGIERRYFEQR